MNLKFRHSAAAAAVFLSLFMPAWGGPCTCTCCIPASSKTAVSADPAAAARTTAKPPAEKTVREVRKAVSPRRSAAQRKVHFESTHNTRDLGGLPTRNGYVKDGMIYRSGAFCYATPSDSEKLASLPLKTVIDLRTQREVEKKEGPDRLPAGCSIAVLHLPMAFKGDRNIGRYYSYALDNDESVAGFFHALANPRNYPLLYHCSAGKDRTGVMTALLLELLGTPRHVIMDDYLESQRNSAKLKVHRRWLREIFGLIDKAGGVDVFLAQQGVKPAYLQAVPAILEQK